MQRILILALAVFFTASLSRAGLRVDLLKKEARQGDVKAQYELGLAYEKGDGIDKNPVEAFGWYQKAAELEHREAQLALAKCYASGAGGEQSDEAAFDWAMKSARQSYGPAQYFVATCYEQGQLGQPKDSIMAAKWAKQAALQNCTEAQYALGSYYEYGLGVERDFGKAVQWYLKSAESDCIAGRLLVGRNYHHWSEYIQSKDSAKRQLVMAAEHGDAESQFNLALCYFNESDHQDPAEGLKWLESAADQEFIPARKKLAELLIHGLVVEKDLGAAETMYLEMAHAGDAECQEILGGLYNGDNGLEPNAKKSAHWYLKAARNGRLNAQVRCIFVYGKGLGREQNRAEAFAWALVVADNGKPIYKRNLEPILTMQEQQTAFKRYSALLMEMREIRKASPKL
jgi:TPR repeat protein